MKKTALYFFIFLNTLISLSLKSQVSAPQLRCVSVTSPTSAVLSWIAPADPLNLFTEYQIWSSPTGLSFSLVGTVNVYSQTSFTHAPSSVGNQAIYYYVRTISSAGTNTSVPSDTLRSISINLSGGATNGVSNLNWNALKSPLLPSSSLTYTVSREAPVGTWTDIYTGNKLNYKDTIIFRCTIYYYYKVEITDASGCISQSNIKGDTCKNLQPPKTVEIDSVSINSNGQAIIGWSASTYSDVVKYVIYKSNGGGSIPVLDTVYGANNTNYTNAGSLANVSSEAYCIAVGDACKNFNVPSLTHNTVFLNAPIYNLCSRTTNLTWTPYLIKDGNGTIINKYDSYKIYCSTNGGVFVNIGSTVGNTNFTHSGLNPSDTYCYFVRVWNSNSTISSSSNSQCFVATGLPGPAYVYINSVSINTASKQVEISYTIDSTNPYKGCTIYKSIDGINFSKLAFVPFSSVSSQIYTDSDVKTAEKNYYYKIQAADDCNNPGVWSDTSKTIVLNVSNDNENTFYNTLTWDDYTKWSGGVESFNIYRAVNGVFETMPISNVPFSTTTYVDNVQDFTGNQGKFSYYVEAVEGLGNIYGFKDIAKSNPADAYVEANVFVPNAFVPKGINNVWLPIAQFVEKTDYKVSVFNRWGDKIFETASDTEGWTGDAATDEVYVYLIEYKNARGEYIQLKGHLNIIR